jgi:hypothetical protein
MEEIGLDDAIRALRRQLSAAVAESQGQELRFGLGPVELEFEMVVSRDAGGGGGIRFWVVSLDGKGSVSKVTTHRIRLRLDPVTADGRPVLTGDDVDREPG